VAFFFFFLAGGGALAFLRTIPGFLFGASSAGSSFYFSLLSAKYFFQAALSDASTLSLRYVSLVF
jgi:hypothetical protein